MPTVDKILLLARDLRVRGEEALAKAECMQHVDARETMRRVAAGYEKLAQDIEDRDK